MDAITKLAWQQWLDYKGGQLNNLTVYLIRKGPALITFGHDAERLRTCCGIGITKAGNVLIGALVPDPARLKRHHWELQRDGYGMELAPLEGVPVHKYQLDFSKHFHDCEALVLLPWDVGTTVARKRQGQLHGCRDVTWGPDHDKIVAAWVDQAKQTGMPIEDRRSENAHLNGH